MPEGEPFKSRGAVMAGDKGTLQALGYVCMVAAWVCVTFTLFVLSEGGTPEIGWPIFAVIFSGATAVFFLKAKRMD
jgi:hypothetical protein